VTGKERSAKKPSAVSRNSFEFLVACFEEESCWQSIAGVSCEQKEAVSQNKTVIGGNQPDAYCSSRDSDF
jgi:hypothetical protein